MKIAIIGSGISGNASAYLLNPHHDITLYEKNDYIGGHSRTSVAKTAHGDVPVDTGFIVFNKRNYPLLTGLFEHLDVPIAPADMSFGVSINHGWLEYGTKTLGSMVAQNRNLIRPAFYKMVKDILAFYKHAPQYLDKSPDITLKQCIEELGMSTWFEDYFIVPMGGCIWSSPMAQMLDFPARTFIQFFSNHGLLSVNDQPQWYTVQGGSREYVKRLTESFKDRIKVGCGATRVVRVADGVEVYDERGGKALFDQVVFASHADQSLAMLENPSDKEQEILSCFRYQPNEMVMHSDLSFMPKRKRAWSSWVYLSEQRKDDSSAVSLSYWMNNLQPLETKTPIIVTLNPARAPKAELTYDRYHFSHPIFDVPAVNAQTRMDEIQGVDRVWYAGAWQRYGFHEDGLMSAVTVAKGMEVDIPWK